MNTNTDTSTWRPVALVPASLSNDIHTTVEVVTVDGAVYFAAYTRDGDSNDNRLTPDQADQLGHAFLQGARQARQAAA